MKNKLSLTVLFFELLAIVFVLASFIAVLLGWPSLPDKIPTHYNLAGDIDAYGDKCQVFVMPVMTIVMYMFFGIISKLCASPERLKSANLPYELTKENEGRTVHALKLILSSMKAEVTGIFAYIGFCAVGGKSLSVNFLPIALGTVTVTLVITIAMLARAGRQRSE